MKNNIKKIDKIENNEEIIPKNLQTIHKTNSLIRSKFPINLSVHSIKLINNLYYQVQKRVGKKDSKGLNYDNLEHYELEFNSSTLRKWMGLENETKYSEYIKQSLEELRQDIKLNNFIDNDGRVWEWMTLSFVNRIGSKIGTEEHKQEKVYSITIDNYLHKEITKSQDKGNGIGWTKIDLDYQKTWKNANTIRLYEFIKSYQNMGYTPPLNLENLNNIFFSKYKYMAEVKRILDRNIKIIMNDSDLIIDYIAKTTTKKHIQLSIKKTTKQQLKEENHEKKKEGFKKSLHKNDPELEETLETEEEMINRLMGEDNE